MCTPLKGTLSNVRLTDHIDVALMGFTYVSTSKYGFTSPLMALN